MKNLLHIFFIFFAVILQISLLPQIAIFGGYANLILLVMLALIFVGRNDEAIIWAGVGGLLLEITSPVHFGYYFFPMIMIYLLVNFLVKKLFTSPAWHLSMFFFFISSVLQDVIWIYLDRSLTTLLIILANAVYSAVLGVILYYFIDYYYHPKEKIKV